MGYYSYDSSSFSDDDIPRIYTRGEVQRVYIDGACRGNGKVFCPPSGYGVFYGENDSRNAAVPLNQVDDLFHTPTNKERNYML